MTDISQTVKAVLNGWLDRGDDADNIDTYSEFAKDIDTVIMGWNTYHQIVTELSPNEWVYNDFTTYVVTHNQKHLLIKLILPMKALLIW